MASIVGELFRSDCFDPLATWWHIFHPTKVGYPTFVGYPTIEVGLPPDDGAMVYLSEQLYFYLIYE